MKYKPSDGSFPCPTKCGSHTNASAGGRLLPQSCQPACLRVVSDSFCMARTTAASALACLASTCLPQRGGASVQYVVTQESSSSPAELEVERPTGVQSGPTSARQSTSGQKTPGHGTVFTPSRLQL